MRTLVLFVTTVMLAVLATPAAAASPTPAQPSAFVPTLTVLVEGETVGGRQVFVPDVILVPQVPIQLEITFHDNDTMGHSFTINDQNSTKKIDTGIIAANATANVTFTVVNITSTSGVISYNGTTFLAEMGPSGILWYCIPHRGTGVPGQGMVGQIELASAQQAAATPEKGVLLRAYWIGIIGIAAMIVWVGISYFVIKSSTPRFRDNREHVRKGLP